MSALVESMLVASVVKETKNIDADWAAQAPGLVESIVNCPDRALAAGLIASKLRFAEAVGFGRGLDRAEKILVGNGGSR